MCVSTGCGHVEMAPDASSSSFANVFDRFSSRRGAPHMLISDHGSNFTGYVNELRTLAEDQLVTYGCLSLQAEIKISIKI